MEEYMRKLLGLAKSVTGLIKTLTIDPLISKEDQADLSNTAKNTGNAIFEAMGLRARFETDEIKAERKAQAERTQEEEKMRVQREILEAQLETNRLVKEILTK